MSNPTPGPWHVGNGDVYADGDRSSDFDDIVICAIGRSGGFRSHEYAVVKAHKPDGRANARLIAAAPDLLEAGQEGLDALTGLVGAFDDGSEEGKHAERVIAQAASKLRAAIAKARGGAA